MASDSTSSSSNTTNTTYRTDSIQGEGNVQAGGNITFSDQGAIKGAGDIVNKSLDVSTDLISKVLNFKSGDTQAALETANKSLGAVNTAAEQAQTAILQAKQNESTGISKTLILTVGGIAAAIAAVFILRK